MRSVWKYVNERCCSFSPFFPPPKCQWISVQLLLYFSSMRALSHVSYSRYNYAVPKIFSSAAKRENVRMQIQNSVEICGRIFRIINGKKCLHAKKQTVLGEVSINQQWHNADRKELENTCLIEGSCSMIWRRVVTKWWFGIRTIAEKNLFSEQSSLEHIPVWPQNLITSREYFIPQASIAIKGSLNKEV